MTAMVCCRSLRTSTLAMLVYCSGVALVTLALPLGVAVHAHARSSTPARSFTHSESLPFWGRLRPSTASSVPHVFLTIPTVTCMPEPA